MMKISSQKDFKRLTGKLIKLEYRFFAPIRDLEDPYDFFQVYENTIAIASNYFKITIDDQNIPFNMKFDLVVIVMDLCIKGGKKELINRILDIPFELDSKLLNEIKNDARTNIIITTLCCHEGRFDLAYNMLSYMYDNIENVPIQDYYLVIRNISELLGALDGIIQENLYNYRSVCINEQIINFSLLLIQMNNEKMNETEVFKKLTADYPEVLKTYLKALKVFKHLEKGISISV